MLIASLLLAQAAAPAACPATDAALPPALAGWTRPGERLELGRAVTVATVDQPAPLKAGVPQGRSYSVVFDVRSAGTYRIAIDQPGWIDVRPADRPVPLASVAHGHGPQCSTIRKLVAFRLDPRAYRLTLSGLQQPRVKVMLVAGD